MIEGKTQGELGNGLPIGITVQAGPGPALLVQLWEPRSLYRFGTIALPPAATTELVRQIRALGVAADADGTA